MYTASTIITTNTAKAAVVVMATNTVTTMVKKAVAVVVMAKATVVAVVINSVIDKQNEKSGLGRFFVVESSLNSGAAVFLLMGEPSSTAELL